MTKSEFIALLTSTPLDEYLDRTVNGVVVPAACPTTVEAAQLACGVYAYNMSLFLKAWEGIPFMKFFMYTGNSVNSANALVMGLADKVDDKLSTDILLAIKALNFEDDTGSISLGGGGGGGDIDFSDLNETLEKGFGDVKTALYEIEGELITLEIEFAAFALKATAEFVKIVKELQNIVGILQRVNPEIESQDLQNWLTAINAWMIDEEKWIDDTIIFSEQGVLLGDLPAPIPPDLPDLVDFVSLPALIAQFGPWGLVIFVGLKVVKRILEAWIEKRVNPGVGELKAMLQDIRDALKKGLLYNDGADSTLSKAFLFDGGIEGANASVLKAGLLFTDVFDSKLKGALERGLLKSITIVEDGNTVIKTMSILELMKMSIDDLAFVDAIIDFGAFRAHIKGKMIEY
jgi:hypothetical protein